MDLKNTFGELVDKLRKARPVIHEITNYVTAESCADAALAAGASPVMADEPEEVIEITAGADALVLNLGTLSFNKQIAMERAAQAAKTKGIPVVLDPVGVMASTVRLNFALKLLNAGYIDIVRGNHSECQALLLGATGGRGVDNMEQGTEEGEALRTAKDAAAKFGTRGFRSLGDFPDRQHQQRQAGCCTEQRSPATAGYHRQRLHDYYLSCLLRRYYQGYARCGSTGRSNHGPERRAGCQLPREEGRPRHVQGTPD